MSSITGIPQNTLTPVQEQESSSSYGGEITKAMTWLALEQNARFIGQAVEFPGTAMTNTLVAVPAL